MKVLLHPTYFPSIATFSAIVQHDVVWEAHDNFQKQTYRNRCYICTDQGKHMLNIPIKHVGGNEGRQKYSEVEMENESRWKKIHWRTLETAYRTSPFFEFYEDDLKPLFECPETSLYQFNLQAMQVLGECLGIQIPRDETKSYEPVREDILDGRFLVEAKKQIHTEFDSYSQVFEERHGYLPDLSVLDLLFNEGTNSLDYLRRQPLSFLNV